MVKLLTYCVLFLGVLLGCAPGVLDPEPSKPGFAGEYFWPADITDATYERRDSINGNHTYRLVFQDITGGRSVTDASSSSSHEFTYRVTDEGILFENISKHSFIPLPEGFRLTSNALVDSIIYVARGMQRVLSTGQQSLLAIDDRGKMFYTADAGMTWTEPAWNGGEITTLNTTGDGNTPTLYAGTKQGSIYRSINPARDWIQIVKSLQNEVTAFTRLDTCLYFVTGGHNVFRASLEGSDTFRISNGLLEGKVTSLAAVQGQQADSVWIVAGTDQGLFRAGMGERDTSMVYWSKAATSQKIEKCLSLIVVNQKYLFALGESNGSILLFSSSDYGATWKAVSNPLKDANRITHDGKNRLLISGSNKNIVSIFSASGNTVQLLRDSEVPAGRINDISAWNGIFTAATDKGVLLSVTSGEQWSNVSETQFTREETIKVNAPGGLLVLPSGDIALDADSGWTAGYCEGMVLGSLQVLQIKATILSPLTKLDLTSYGSLVFEDILPVKYSVGGLSPHSFYLMIYFAKGTGPVLIRQMSGQTVLSDTYLLPD